MSYSFYLVDFFKIPKFIHKHLLSSIENAMSTQRILEGYTQPQIIVM